MAEAILIFEEDKLDKTTSLYELYSRFYEGMNAANMVDAPDFSSPPLTELGEIDMTAINKKIAEYSTILVKNSSYMMANSIMTTVGGSGGGGTSGVGFLSRNGDSMVGRLTALYGFQAGYDNQVIFETVINADEKKKGLVHGHLIIDEDTEVKGRLNLSDSGVYMSNVNVLYYTDNKLNISSSNILVTGGVVVDGTFKLGNIIINENGLFNGDQEYYYKGNCNKKEVDWSMRNGHVYGTLQVDGDTTLQGILTSLDGFQLGLGDKKLFYSNSKEDGTNYLQLATDLSLLTGYGIKFSDKYIIKVRGGADNIVSFSAPGMTMNLGDSDGETPTTKIALQTGIYNHSGIYRIISQFGDGNFPNSFSAGCGNSGPTVLQTYYKSGNDCGVISKEKIRIGDASGPSLSTGTNRDLVFEAPFVHVSNEVEQTDPIKSILSYQPTTSLFKDQSLGWSSSLNFDTDGEFFTFNKSVEAVSFSIISEKYKTQLLENALFFGDGIFLEGVSDGILYNGEAYFSSGLGSKRFASGFSGYGWNISENKLYGGIAATFDELTIRKKMRIYELEVQKSTVTNGSLWVSDSCSGDLVEEII